MATKLVQPERIAQLNDIDIRDGDYVLYWMQQSQRAECNHALEYAIQQANEMGQRLLVVFGLTDNYPEANLRHYRFLLEGVQETQASLERRGIKMAVQHGPPDEVALRLAKDASLLVCDRGYLRHQKQWRERAANEANCRVVQVESDVVVPVDTVSGKQEYAARTIRPKINKLREQFLVELRTTPLDKDSLNLSAQSLKLDDIGRVLGQLQLDESVTPVNRLFRGGTSEAKRLLRRFQEEHFDRYESNRNRPETDDISHMSMYLHFGQISPVEIAIAIQSTDSRRKNKDRYLEELLVRRELAQNFVHFTPNYDQFACLPGWAKQTLREHAGDRREYEYTQSELEAAATHDRYWNAAMREMKHTGFMHNYMRMYWGKKILEWSRTPEAAYRTALAINNKYFLDGRDANSYANVGWIFGLHDRAFAERPIFGKVRYMSADGLKRKCDIEGYVEKVDRLVDAHS